MTQISKLFNLNSNDFIKGVVVAFMAAILGGLQQALTAHGVDVAAYDWGFIFNLGVTAGLGYLTKNWMTDSSGKIFGAI